MVPDGQSGPMELPPVLAKQAEKWNFLSKRRLKMQLKNWGHHWRHNVLINKLIYTDGKPTHFESKTHVMFEKGDIDGFMVELANIADLHGIVKLHDGTIWVKQTTNPKELNIDATIMERIMDRLQERWLVKIVNVDGTFNLTKYDFTLKVMAN
jgi:hypothetical protein